MSCGIKSRLSQRLFIFTFKPDKNGLYLTSTVCIVFDNKLVQRENFKGCYERSEKLCLPLLFYC